MRAGWLATRSVDSIGRIRQSFRAFLQISRNQIKLAIYDKKIGLPAFGDVLIRAFSEYCFRNHRTEHGT